MRALRATQCDNPLTNRGPRSQRPGFAEAEPPDDMGTIRGKNRPLNLGVQLTGKVQIAPTQRVGSLQ